ncbi:MAG: CvpA family protein [Bacteroidales bacterium]|nr:CvpA family protein [Bacteroidales bacterium]
MATFDIILLALFIPGLILGITKGVVTQIVSLASVAMGAFLASRFSPDLTQVAMLQFGTQEPATHVVCFILIFLVTALVMALVGSLITKLIKIATLGWMNRLLGVVFSVFTTALLIGLLISVFEGLNASWGIVAEEKLADLKVYPILRDFASGIVPQLKVFIDQLVTGSSAESCQSV